MKLSEYGPVEITTAPIEPSASRTLPLVSTSVAAAITLPWAKDQVVDLLHGRVDWLAPLAQGDFGPLLDAVRSPLGDLGWALPITALVSLVLWALGSD
jgi:hypothetical protein